MTDEAKRIEVDQAIEYLREDACVSCIFNSFIGECTSISDCYCRKIANLIASLSAELEQVKRERDAAVKEWKQSAIAGKSMCDTCMFSDDEGRCWNDCIDGELWQWRGVKEESDV